MAFNNKGADWLQMDKDTRNPYFGASTLKCGQVMEVIGEEPKWNDLFKHIFKK